MGMDESLDEMQHNSKSVDDWGVNRDTRQAIRSASLPTSLPKLALAPLIYPSHIASSCITSCIHYPESWDCPNINTRRHIASFG